jgi:hypothetical protein
MKKSSNSNSSTAPLPVQSDLRELLRLSLDGFLPPANGLTQLFDRLEASR